MSDRMLQVEIVSRLAKIWAGEASYVSIPAADGYLGILPGRQPLLATIASGEIAVTTEADGQVQKFPVDSGFASVDSDYVTIVVAENSQE